MALSPQEFEKLKAQLAAKKSVTSLTPSNPSFVDDTVTDAKDAFLNTGQRLNEAGEGIVAKVTDPSLSLGQKVLGAGAEAFRGIGRFIGGGAVDVAKTVVPQGVEDAVSGAVQGAGEAVASTDIAQEMLARYRTLDPDTKRNVDNALGFAEGLGELAGGGAAIKGAKATLKASNTVLREATNALGGITEVGASGIKKAVGQQLDPASIMQRVARISKGKQADFESRAGESVGEYLVKRDIFGSPDQITDQLYTRFNTSKGEVDTALAGLKGEFKSTAIGNALQQLDAREAKISAPGVPSADRSRIIELRKKHNGAGLTMEEINEVKRLFERNVKLDYIKENAPLNVEAANRLDDAIRQFQFSKAKELGFQNLPELNRETMLAKQLMDDLGAEYAGSAGNNAISLTDWLLLAEATGNPTAAAGLIAKKALSSKGVMSAIAKRLSGNTATVPIPEAIIGEPSVSGYLEFLKRNAKTE